MSCINKKDSEGSSTGLSDCPICRGSMVALYSNIILNAHMVQYFRCNKCGFIRTEEPYWLDEAYSSAIAVTDVGLLSRNIKNVQIIKSYLKIFGHHEDMIVDISGGYGVLARLLRDAGVDCYTTDKYCENIFAKGFEPPLDCHASLLMAFEVLEHIQNPCEFINDIFKKYNCSTLIFSTSVTDGKIPSKDWWYFSCETGQHISFYTKTSLTELASQLDCKYIGINDDYHIITRKSVAVLNRAAIKSEFVRRLAAYSFSKSNRSLLVQDYEAAKSALQFRGSP
jgi:hypothetical protein